MASYSSVNPVPKPGKHISPYSVEAMSIAVNYLRIVKGYPKIPTSRQFCMDIIHTYLDDVLGKDEEGNQIQVSQGFDYADSGLITGSSIYGIACEHMGFITDTDTLDYISMRSGIKLYLDTECQSTVCESDYTKDYITFRDLLKTLDVIPEVNGKLRRIKNKHKK